MLKNRQQSFSEVPKSVRNHVAGSGLPFRHEEIGPFLQRHAAPATGTMGEIARAAIKLQKVPTDEYRPLTQALAIEHLHHKSAQRSEEGRKLNSVLQGALTTFRNHQAICKICTEPFTAGHLEEDHHGILSKATPQVIKSLLDANTAVAHCRTCDTAFESTVTALLHICLHQHHVTCLPCTLFHDLQETDTLTNIQHFQKHSLVCPETGCNDGGLFQNLHLLFFHLATTHQNQDSVIYRSTPNKLALQTLLGQFITVPLMHTNTYSYANLFNNSTEQQQFLHATDRHPVKTFSFALAILLKNLPESPPSKKRSFKSLQILNSLLAENIRPSDIRKVEEADLLSNDTRAQHHEAEENPKGFSETDWVILSCHALYGLGGPEISEFKRDDYCFTDRNLLSAALTTSGRILPTDQSTYHDLDTCLDQVVATQNVLMEVKIHFSLCEYH